MSTTAHRLRIEDLAQFSLAEVEALMNAALDCAYPMVMRLDSTDSTIEVGTEEARERLCVALRPFIDKGTIAHS